MVRVKLSAATECVVAGIMLEFSEFDSGEVNSDNTSVTKMTVVAAATGYPPPPPPTFPITPRTDP